MDDAVKNLEAKYDKLLEMMRRMEEEHSSKVHSEVGILGPPPNQGMQQKPLSYFPKLEFPNFDGNHTKSMD
ncbi:unnamed protein product [Amaranthus hypochondriacus]